MDIKNTIINMFNYINTNSQLLTIETLKTNEMKNIYKKSTIQEINFYLLIEQFDLIKYTKYQPNGSQKTPDFNISYNDFNIDIELKSSNSSNRIILNDGFFIDNYIYIITIKSGTYICMGKDIYKEYEKEIINKLKIIKDDINMNYRNNSNLYITCRFANSYKIDHIDNNICIDNVINYINKQSIIKLKLKLNNT
jgi:hypothetical protein